MIAIQNGVDPGQRMRRSTTAYFGCALSGKPIPLPHVWEHLVGSDHAPMALRADWQAQLRRCHAELGFRYVRFHGLLSDDMSTLLRVESRSCSSYFNVDQIFDFVLSIGMKPFVELSFMPRALASGGTTVFHYCANVTPPTDYDQWAALVAALAAHVVDRYGIDEVSQWYFEVWNEPNLKQFWTGSQDQYFQLYRGAAIAIKSVHPSLRIGGPATAANAWTGDFLEYCDANRVPADFVSTHHYPTDGLGNDGDAPASRLADGHRGALREQASETRRRAGSKPVFYTEWNTSADPRDPLHDESYAAAFVVKTALEASSLVQGYGYWTFSDIFEEEGFPSQPFHGGFGLLSIHGIAKPSYRAFELLHGLGTEMLPMTGNHATVDAWVVQHRSETAIVLTNHALPRHPIDTEWVRVALNETAIPESARIERIDARHANAKSLWQDMGEPEYPTAVELAKLHDASRLQQEAHSWRYEDSCVAVDVMLPPHAVAVVTLQFATNGYV